MHSNLKIPPAFEVRSWSRNMPAIGLLAIMSLTAVVAGCGGGEKLQPISGEADFQANVIRSRQPVLVEFYKGG